MPDQRARRLGARRSERPRRIHAHLVQRLRDRRREPVRRRAAPHFGAHPDVCTVHRPGARPRRHERERGPQERQAGAGGQDADDAREPGARGGRDAGLHESAGRRRFEGAAGRFPPRPQRRRGRPFAARHDVREKALHHDPARRAHPSHGERADPYPARHPQTALELGAGAAPAHYLHAARLRALVALFRAEAHLGADRKAIEVAVQDAVAVEVILAVVIQSADEAVTLGKELVEHAVRLAVEATQLRLAAAQRRGPLQLALDRGEGEVDQRRQLVLDVADLLLLFYRQVMVGRDPHLDHHAVAVALVMLALLARQGDVAGGNALGVAVELEKPLRHVVLDPGRALDAMEGDLRVDLHGLLRYKANFLRRMSMIPLRCAAVAAAVFALTSTSALAAPTTLRASHQFPGGRGDVRDEMVQIIARDAKAANVDLEVQVYPGASLFKPNEQWNALVNGQLDMSSFPLDYASGKVRAFGATLMPGLVRNHERAQRMNDSAFMKSIKAQIDKAGVSVLADAWLAGAIASKKGCIRKPDDIKGLKVRSAGPTFASMWQSAGASIVSIPSNEVYNALQTGVADATDTSSGSFVSFRIYEQVKCLTAPGDNALWFMYEPVLMSKKSFNRLNKKQQEVLLQAGRKSQEFFAKEAKGLDDEMVKIFKDHKVEVITLTPAEYDQWLKVAEKSSYAELAKDVPNGKKLIEEALSVK